MFPSSFKFWSNYNICSASRRMVFTWVRIKNTKGKQNVTIRLPHTNINIKELAQRLGCGTEDICKVLKRFGVCEYDEYSILSKEILSQFSKATNVHFIMEKEENKQYKDVYRRNLEKIKDKLKPRKPIVTIMGHVDHGKTTLLDTLRLSSVVDTEFGGITQHIGAFNVPLAHYIKTAEGESESEISYLKEHSVTFIDTPGHAVFSAMRQRGANCTDIAVLVVSVKDGIMPQTRESIRYCQEANVPIIIALNKMDKLYKSCSEMLSKFNLKDKYFQEFSHMFREACGDQMTDIVPISAKYGWNLTGLLEIIIATTEVRNVAKADWASPAEGTILEIKKDTYQGFKAVLLLQHGTLKKGIIGIAGESIIRVKTINDTVSSDKNINLVYPGDPVIITGFRKTLPEVGDMFREMKSLKEAEEVIKNRIAYRKTTEAENSYEKYMAENKDYFTSRRKYLNQALDGKKIRLLKDAPNLNNFIAEKEMESPSTDFNVMVKADVEGSLDAIIRNIEKLSIRNAHKFNLKLSYGGIGSLTKHEYEMAVATDSIVYMFNLPVQNEIQNLPVQNEIIQNLLEEKVRKFCVKHFNVIYHLFDALKEYIEENIPFEKELEIVGECKLMSLFGGNKKLPTVNGVQCLRGTLHKDDHWYRIISEQSDESKELDAKKDNLKCVSMKQLKNDVDIIMKDQECGLIFNDNDGNVVHGDPGDIIQCCQWRYQKPDIYWIID